MQSISALQPRILRELPLTLSQTDVSRVKDLRALRKRTERAARIMHARTRKLALTLVGRGLTIRNVGALLGISYQRVQQIMKGL